MSKDTTGNAGSETWRPIETAPKDGRQILAFMPTYYCGAGGYACCVWADFIDKPGWYSHVSGRHEPTHWMPLPDPPDTTEAP